MRRSKRQRVESTDFRKVSELVHNRRAERARNSETLRQNPEEAEAAVRTYRPEQRLRSVDHETQQLVEDSRYIPRTWYPDPPPLNIPRSAELSVRANYVVILGVNLLVATIPLSELYPMWLDGLRLDELLPFFCSLAAMSILILATGSIYYFRELRKLAWLGLTLCAGELLFFALLLSR
jgi:hypothetical protein